MCRCNSGGTSSSSPWRGIPSSSLPRPADGKTAPDRRPGTGGIDDRASYHRPVPVPATHPHLRLRRRTLSTRWPWTLTSASAAAPYSWQKRKSVTDLRKRIIVDGISGTVISAFSMQVLSPVPSKREELECRIRNDHQQRSISGGVGGISASG
ncbi:unnamed protein product [Urochloa humidicola]